MSREVRIKNNPVGMTFFLLGTGILFWIMMSVIDHWIVGK
jgi:hypothetical protein